MEPVSIATILASATSVFDVAFGCIADVASTIAGNNMLLIGCVGVPLCGIGVGMFKRLLSSRV